MRAALLCLALAGCASTHMKQYVGQDIRAVILNDGPPLHAMDMGDGTRAFLYPFGGGTFNAPAFTTTTGSVTRTGSTVWLDSTAITVGGGTFTVPPCMMSYLAHWDAQRNTWIIHAYRVPQQLVC